MRKKRKGNDWERRKIRGGERWRKMRGRGRKMRGEGELKENR